MRNVGNYVVAVSLIMLAACQNDAAKQQPIDVILQAEKSEPLTLQIPRGYIEEPKKPEGALPNVILRIAAKDLEQSATFVADSEVRVLIEPVAGKADAAQARHAAALRKPKFAEEALLKSAEKSRGALTTYSYPNATQEAEAYYLKSKTGDVFVDCRRSVCSALKTWRKRVHLRVDCQPTNISDVQALDAAIDGLMQMFMPDVNESATNKKS